MLATTPGRRFPEENCLLASLPDDEYARLAPALEHVWLAPRQILGLPDESISRVYFPRTAVASLLVPMENGSAVEGATVGKEGMLGLEGFLGGATSPVEVVVHVAGTAGRMDAGAFRDQLHHSPAIHGMMQHYTLALLHQITRTAGCNRVHSVRERVARVLLMIYDGSGQPTFPLTHELLALMLGVRRASVTLAAMSLQMAGFIQYRRGRMSILDLDGLKASACVDYRLSREAHDRLRNSPRIQPACQPVVHLNHAAGPASRHVQPEPSAQPRQQYRFSSFG
jgi:CRP-like cAMP-binding protein